MSNSVLALVIVADQITADIEKLQLKTNGTSDNPAQSTTGENSAKAGTSELEVKGMLST